MILIINNSDKTIEQVSWTNKIKRILEHLIPEEKSIIVNENNEMNNFIVENKHQIKGVILGGSELRINDKQYLDKILDNVLPIIELEVPILGVCFGHQVIAKTYQATISSFTNMVSGHKKIRFLPDQLFYGIEPEALMYNAHFDYVDRAPLFFNIIARDPNGIIYGMKHIYKPIYGIQFHPEFSNFGNGLQIYKNFLKICGVNPRDVEYSDIPEVKHKDSKKLID